MNWYKRARQNKSASMNVMVADYQYSDPKNDVLSISNFVTDQLFYYTDFLKKMTEFERAYWQKNRVQDFITADGDSNFEPVGTLNIYLLAIPEKIIPTLLEYVAKILIDDGFKISSPITEDSDSYKSKVARIQILENPHINKAEDKPPELNMSNANAQLIFEKVLKYDLSEYSLTVPAFDLINRINKMSEDKIEENERPWQREWGPGQVESINMGLYSEQIKERLSIIKQIAQWGLDHGYKRINII